MYLATVNVILYLGFNIFINENPDSPKEVEPKPFNLSTEVESFQ
jgi:hypothetical protein